VELGFSALWGSLGRFLWLIEERILNTKDNNMFGKYCVGGGE